MKIQTSKQTCQGNIFWQILMLTIISLLGVNCSSPTVTLQPTEPAATRSGSLTPFAPTAVTPSPRHSPTTAVTPTPLPSATPTPRTHTVSRGEDMFGIALRYGISLEAIKTANPEVNPGFLSIGAVLTIPFSTTPLAGAEATEQPSAPTAVPVVMGPLYCQRSSDGGVWCFQSIHNNQGTALESVSAIFRVTENQGKDVLEQRAFLPLDLLPPGASLPLLAHFPAKSFSSQNAPVEGSSELVSALPNPDDGRYIAAEMRNQKVLLSEDQRSATVYGDAILQAPGTVEAKRVWVAAVAYNTDGQVIGVRRWENAPEQVLSSESALPVVLQIYSIRDRIARVEVTIEARP